MNIDRSAGKPADPSILVNVAKLVAAYYDVQPDLADPKQRVVFGTSGHRGSAFDGAFNDWHILAITQAICDHRKAQKIDGPLFLGMDTHALSTRFMQRASSGQIICDASKMKPRQLFRTRSRVALV